jgi:hypothetical protein
MKTNIALSFGGASVIDEKELASRLQLKRVFISRNDLSVELNRDLEILTISFRNLGDPRPVFTLSSMATLALLLRQVAESGKKAHLILPSGYRGKRSSLQWLFGHLQFVNLFADRTAPWTQHISIEGEIPPVRLDDRPAEGHYT